MSKDVLLNKTKILNTARTLIRQYYDVLRVLQLDAHQYRLDPIILLNVAERYWLDVDRLHRYHSIERIDRHKIAGYLTHWICKLRPVAVAQNDIYLKNGRIPAVYQ